MKEAMHLIIINSPSSNVGHGCWHEYIYSPSCPGYDIKQSDGKAPALEIWGMWSTPSLLSGPLRPRVVAPDRVLSK